MKKGKYQSVRKRRRRRINWTGVFFWLILLVLLIVGIVLLCRSCGRSKGPEPKPGTSVLQTQPQQSTQPAEVITPSETVTEPIVPPTTEPVTAPTTEPTTEPVTEPTTEPITEPTTEPDTEPSEEPDDPVEEPIVEPEYNSELGQNVAAIAQESVGKPYAHGGEGPDDFDTTGFIAYCFRESGVSAPRALSAQFEYGAPVAKDALKPGDVVFFSQENPGEAEYVGIYIGEGKFIAVSSSKNAVTERDLSSSYYSERYVGARRYPQK